MRSGMSDVDRLYRDMLHVCFCYDGGQKLADGCVRLVLLLERKADRVMKASVPGFENFCLVV
jgi:hypothetical protein